MTKVKKLFTPFHKGSLKLKNHLVMAPITRSRAIGNIPTEVIATIMHNAQNGARLHR